MFNYYSLFSTLSFIFFLFLLFLTSTLSNLSLHTVAFRSNKTRRVLPTVLLSVTEEIQQHYVKDPIPLLPPINVTEEERINWFRENKSKFAIIHSNSLTKRFVSRTREFFDGWCEIRFFMTWISPVNSFGNREFLSLESLFKAHPFGCLMILSTTMDSINGNKVLKPLQDEGYRVVAVAPDLKFLFKNTPAESWFKELKKGNFDPGEIPLSQNLSNLIRLAVLYKYGGVYLDTDVIVLKKFSALRNSIGAQTMDLETGNWSRLNNAVLVFDKKHPLLFKFIQEFSLTFNGNKWGHNGPYLVSRVVERLEGRPGFNFTVLPPMAFYPVYWNRVGGFFERPQNLPASRWVDAKLLQLRGETYGIHLWNRQSSSLPIEEGSVMSKIISTHCLFCKDDTVTQSAF
ncbi:uncharacterized protein LOC143856663 [Tasmannia lanceolata]|uniref:uncharacterized protein LOC143856663 n=1 Tax=Tasmannia lanceolata TaxID=3420 RepID=UPI0040646722